MDHQLERFNNERKELFNKVELLNTNLTNKDRELTLVKNKLETAIEEADKKKKVIEEYKQEYQIEKNKLTDKIE
jgi:regulator of replication initiation timing